MARRHVTHRGSRHRQILLLLIEDNPDHVELFCRVVTTHFPQTQVHTAEDIESGLALLTHHTYAMVWTDAFLHNRSVVRSLPVLIRAIPDIPIMVLADSGDETLAVDAIKHGATEYLIKNRETMEHLPTLLRKYLTRRPRKQPTHVSPTSTDRGQVRHLRKEIQRLQALLKKSRKPRRP